MNQITSSTFLTLKKRFLAYVKSFAMTDDHVKQHFELKIKHTFCVISNIQIIAKKTGLTSQEYHLARIIALFHDIGRFKQFMIYRTFNDEISVNHAELGIEVLCEQGFLKQFEPSVAALIKVAVLHHNIPSITTEVNGKALFFSKMLRDADKIDIWKLMTEIDIIYTIDQHEITDHYEISDAIYQSYREKRVVTLDHATSMNDFRMLRLSWIFDMNLAATFSLLIKKQYATKILAKIPRSERLEEIKKIIHEYMQQQIA
jgi:putative nucleotidyltransferase with HDIG domain